MHRTTQVSLVLLAVGLLLPPSATAAWLAGPGRDVAGGVWILKGALVLDAALLLSAVLWAPRGGTFEALVPRGLRRPRPASASAHWAVGGLLALATALRLHALEVGPWYDEIDTWVHYARAPLGTIATTFDSQNQHLLYSLSARLSLAAIGDGVFALRLPAAVFGVLSVGALWIFARRLTTDREALFAAALLTVSYHHVWFSQNARGYTGLLLFTLLGSAVFLDMLAEREPEGHRRPVLYALAMGLAVATHATAAVAVAAHGLIWLAVFLVRGPRAGANRWAPLHAFLLAGAFSLTAYALVLPQFLETLFAPTMPGAETEWKSPLWLARETMTVLASGLFGSWLAVFLALAVVLLGLASYARQSPWVLATLLLGTGLLAAALVATGHNLWPRLFFASAGFAVLVAIRGLASWIGLTARAGLEGLRGGLLTVVLCLVCLTSAATLPRAYQPKQDFQGAREHLLAALQPGDAVVALDMAALPFEALYGSGWKTADNLPGLQEIERIHTRTWVIYTTPTRLKAELPDVWEHLQARYGPSGTFYGTVHGGEVVVMVTPPTGGLESPLAR